MFRAERDLVLPGFDAASVPVEGNETFQIVLLPASGYDLGTPSTTTVTIHDATQLGVVDPSGIGQPRRYVGGLYSDLFGRRVDEMGLVDWSTNIRDRTFLGDNVVTFLQ